MLKIKKIIFVGLLAVFSGVFFVSNANAQAMGGEFTGRDYYSKAEFLWQAGQEPVDMMSTFEGFCFMTGVVGKFDGANDRVRIYVLDNRWMLGGSANDESVAIAARCVRLNEIPPN